MKCPHCGSEMNHHADKLDFAAGLEAEGALDQAMGGVVMEVYTCPKCGNVEMQKD